MFQIYTFLKHVFLNFCEFYRSKDFSLGLPKSKFVLLCDRKRQTWYFYWLKIFMAKKTVFSVGCTRTSDMTLSVDSKKLDCVGKITLIILEVPTEIFQKIYVLRCSIHPSFRESINQNAYVRQYVRQLSQGFC